MAHYALINQQNVVTFVFVGRDETDGDWESYYSSETERCLRTSYNTYGGLHLNDGEPFRKNFAGIGYTYDEARDAFIPPKPFDSWVLNEDTCLWDAPVPYPSDGDIYIWNEDTLEWVAIGEPS